MDGSQFLDAGKFSFAALTIALLLFSVLSTHKNTYKRFDNINNNSERFTLRNLLFSEAKVKSYIISHSLQNKGTSWSRSLICHPLQVIGCLRFLTVSHLYKAQTFKNWTPFSILKHCFCCAALHGLDCSCHKLITISSLKYDYLDVDSHLSFY